MSDLMLEIFVEMSANIILSHIFLTQNFYENINYQVINDSLYQNEIKEYDAIT